MNAPHPTTTPEQPGTPYAGGIYLGRFFNGADPYALIGAPKAELVGAPDVAKWNKTAGHVAGALSVYDGLANTRAMAEAGSDLANWAQSLRIDGRDDWYLWSRGEALLAYAADLQGVEAFARNWYWTSTQPADDPGWAWIQSFFNGVQYGYRKSDQCRVFAVRREPIR